MPSIDIWIVAVLTVVSVVLAEKDVCTTQSQVDQPAGIVKSSVSIVVYDVPGETPASVCAEFSTIASLSAVTAASAILAVVIALLSMFVPSLNPASFSPSVFLVCK